MLPTLRLIQINDQLARANAALWRIFRTIDMQPNVQGQAGSRCPASDTRAMSTYDRVWFEYEAGQPVIKGMESRSQSGRNGGICRAVG